MEKVPPMINVAFVGVVIVPTTVLLLLLLLPPHVWPEHIWILLQTLALLVRLGSTKQRMVLVVNNVGRATKILTKMFRVLHLVTTVTQAKNRVSVLRNAIKLILQRFPSATPAHRMPNSKMNISCSIDKTALASVGAPSKMSMIQCDCIVFFSD